MVRFQMRARGGWIGWVWLLAWPLAWAEPAPHTVPNTLAQRMMACTLCHGAEGQATASGYFPRIAGKPAGYLYNQLTHFRDGRRQNPGMANLLDHLSDAYLRDIAEHFAAIDLPYPPPQTTRVTPAERERAEALVQRGDPARQLPACAACHGERLTGVNPAVPGLLGLPRDYLIGQLGGWQTGLRHALAPDCMAQVAKALSPEDVGALASWLSAQALPANAHPAPPSEEPMPLRCGSAVPGDFTQGRPKAHQPPGAAATRAAAPPEGK
jgi:cytochrome c553